MAAEDSIRVWDAAVRLFHWGFAAAVLLAYLVGDARLDLHVWLGYTALGLLGFRLLWGIAGTRHARFRSFVRGPREVAAYLGQVVRFRARRHIGHNPAGGAMVVALLTVVALTGLSGLLTYGAVEFSGPLAAWIGGVSPGVANGLESMHEWLANLTLWLVGLHLLGVLIASLQHRENLVRAMVTGNKRLKEE